MEARILLLFSILLLGTVTSSQFAFADGNDSPLACTGSPTDNWANSETSNVYDAGAGNTIDSICIKDGSNSFGGLQHSALITVNSPPNYGDGDSPNTCYSVTGLGSQFVTVTETGAAGCMGISHVDGITDGDMVGGSAHIIDKTALMVTGAQVSASWMIPVLISAIGIGVFVVTRK